MNSLLRIFLLAFAVATTMAAPPSLPEDEAEDHDDRLVDKIIHGTAAQKGQFPWQAYLLILKLNGLYYSCGGSLIHPSWILTAAHCTQNSISVSVRLGSLLHGSGGVNIDSTAIFTHEGYNKTSNINNANHDIALVKLPCPVAQCDDIKVIQLVPDSFTVFNKLQVSGWGQMSDVLTDVPDTLMFANMAQISYQDCRQFFNFITTQTMCIVGTSVDPLQSSCSGDSGGPVIIPGPTPYLVAIVSFGTFTCMQGTPVGDLRVVPYKTWIKNRTGLTL